MEERRIKNFENYIVKADGTVIGARGKVLKADPNSVGYLRVTLSKDGKPLRRFVHQLVAEAFYPEGKCEGKVVHHKDGNRTNNHKDNLEYLFSWQNVQDGWDRGRVNPNHYDEETKRNIKTCFVYGYSIKETSERLGRDRGTIARYFREFRERATTIP